MADYTKCFRTECSYKNPFSVEKVHLKTKIKMIRCIYTMLNRFENIQNKYKEQYIQQVKISLVKDLKYSSNWLLKMSNWFNVFTLKTPFGPYNYTFNKQHLTV